MSLSPDHLPSQAKLVERIERLQQAAQELQALYAAAPPPAQGEAVPHADGECRVYHLSHADLQREHELLKRYRVQDLPGLLKKLYMLLVGVVKLMNSTHHDVRVKGYVIASLGDLLQQASNLALRMRNVYGAMKRTSA